MSAANRTACPGSRVLDHENLVRRCCARDGDAWNELYHAYLPLVRGSVSRFLSAEHVDDGIQEAFISVFRALPAYESGRSLDAFILDLSKKAGIDLLRRNLAKKRGGGKERDGENPDTLPAYGADPETLTMDMEHERLLRRALQQLSAACIELISLRYDRGLSYKEISTMLGTQEPTLRVRFQRCVRKLGDVFHALPPIPEEAIP